MVMRLLLAALLFATLTGTAAAKTLRLLTVGNSFSQNATRHLDGLAKAGGHTLIHRPIVVGGASLELHAEKARQHAADPQAKAGRYSNGRSLAEMLREDRWDVVTIQQASIKSHDPATYQPFAGQLRDLIAAEAPQARLHVHQTWAYRSDDPRFSRPSGKPGEPASELAMHQGLTAAYTALAKALEAPLLPVGDAFHLATLDPRWRFQPDPGFDPKQAKPGEVPPQKHSLHVGWIWRQPKGGGRAQLVMDGHHANLAGEYLGACVWYEVLFGDSAVGSAFVPKGLDPAFARFLQETAHRAVLERRP